MVAHPPPMLTLSHQQYSSYITLRLEAHVAYLWHFADEYAASDMDIKIRYQKFVVWGGGGQTRGLGGLLNRG